MLRLLAATAALALIAPSAAYADDIRDKTTPILESLKVPQAWSLSRGAGVTVAVLDSGVDPDQADLTGSVTTGPDYTSGANPAGVGPKRLHGTNMASIIAGHGHGPGNADGIMGVAPQARLLALRVILENDEPGFNYFASNERFEGTIAQGVRYAVDHGVDVINLSLGRSSPTKEERQAVAYALSKNVVVVAAAGNGGASEKARRTGHAPFSYPASFPGVISVAAVDENGAHAGFSNRNSSVVVSAPGVHIIGAGPGGQYWIGDGTSPATAFVSGVAALIRSRHPGLAPALVTQAIVASPHPTRRYDLGTGFGEIDARQALTESDRLASARPNGLGLPPETRFTTAAPHPVTVVHHDTRTIVITALICALAVAGMVLGFTVAAVRLRTRRAPLPQPE
ncbi:S8 family serine peptidase [Actinomadura barringtoniae]|uniref:S8 family serine peptidase n=1 Tax=Actinomadura barringtoniae TaxID=1427535 RepID=A0A939T9G7_9ACTN|nr:S8 family serine peptidase [Actinomadura barringtoniae]MBO2455138.1 S8 family serine peptidase [Actinomadura barringtoniae]